MLQAPVKVFGSVSVAVNQDLYLLGGYFGEPGCDYDVVFSSQILKKRHSEPKLRILLKLAYMATPPPVAIFLAPQVWEAFGAS